MGFLVGDDLGVGRAVRAYLERADNEAVIERCTLTARHRTCGEFPLIVLSWMPPGVDGLEFRRRHRQLPC